MRCPHCGSGVEDGASFCSACGKSITPRKHVSEVVQQAPQFQQPTASAVPSKPKSGNGLRIALIVAAVVVIVLVAVIAVKLFVIDQQDSSSNTTQSAASQSSSASQGSGTSSSTEQVDLGFSGITSVVASSTLPTDSINMRDYSATSLLDDNQYTVWCENVPGVGIDEFVTFSGPSEQTFHGFEIRNGHQDSVKLYYANARATSLRVLVDRKLMETVHLEDVGLNWQRITFVKPYTGREITLQIATAEAGTSYEDCCISDVKFF